MIVVQISLLREKPSLTQCHIVVTNLNNQCTTKGANRSTVFRPAPMLYLIPKSCWRHVFWAWSTMATNPAGWSSGFKRARHCSRRHWI